MNIMKQMPGTEANNVGWDEPLYREMLGRLPAAVYICDEEGYITFYNQAAVLLWGRVPEIGKERWNGFLKMYRPDGTPIALEESPTALALREARTRQNEEIIIERPDGSRRTILSSPEPFFDAAGTLKGALNILMDITRQGEIKQSLEKELNSKTDQLKKSEQRYHLMIDEVEDYAILLLNRDGDIQNWNKGAEKIKGYASAEIVGKNFRMFYTKEDQEGGLPERLINEAVTQGKANHEGWRVRKDGTRFWGSVVITALHDNENSIIGFSKVTRDLTQRKLNEDAILEKSRLFEVNNRELEKMNQELSSFVYVSSHDLQEPLRKIQTFSSYLLQFENAHLTDKGKDYLKRMDATAGRMKVLIHDLLVYSRTSNTDAPAEAIPFEVFLQGAKDELKEIIEEKKAVIESGPLPRLRVIAFQFQQLFTNIVSNSLKYAKKGVAPHVVIAADIVDGSLVADKEARADALYHHISFADNGIGFAPANNHKIFEIFKRLHTRDEYEGTGIGLSICKKIVENHAGFITAEGEPQQGAVIHVYLPV